jgi:hypothetical protein
VRSRRPATSALLLAGAVVLIVSILIGEKLGDRVLLQTEERVPIAGAGITPVPQVEPSDRDDLRNWKRLQVVAVATDPGFPDPRVTRPPTPRPTARPSPSPSPSATPTRKSIYTPPPLPLPLVSHLPTEVSTEPPVP